MTDAPLLEHHVLEYPGGYTRSVGPAVSRYLTGLRDGVIVGIRLQDGRVMVPPTEYDPVTAAAIDDYLEVGPLGTVEAFTWVAEPRAGKHHLDHPFAFALVRPDGADTAMVHVVDAGSPDGLTVGTRVRPRWASARVGFVTDLEAWVPLADGDEPTPAPPNQAAEQSAEPVAGIVTPIALEYEINAGVAASKYLRGLAERKMIGQHAVDSTDVYVPPRGSDPKTGEATEVEVEVSQVGTVTTFCITNVPGLSDLAPEIPYVCAQILLDGSDTPWFGLVQGIPADEVRIGMRVGAVWVDHPTADARSVKWFEPTGDPDAPYDSFKEFA